MAFGTGAVKITPGHDFNDFECGKRNKLEVINIMNDDGTLNEEGKPFTGMDRLDAREAVMKKLAELKLDRGKKEHKLSIGVCQRVRKDKLKKKEQRRY
jgi:valyl-tRNA synthetase